MKTSHIQFLSTDLLKLPGLLYEPDQPSRRAAIWLHGMGDSGVFYSPKRITALAESLTGQGIALLAFNNRGAHNSKVLTRDNPELPKTDQKVQAGTFYELISDCIYDIDGAAEFLDQSGFSELYLAGHSTGANKICVYDARRPTNKFLKYVLAGPGDDTGLFFKQLGQAKFERALTYAQRAVAAGAPQKIMPIYSGLHPFSAQSAADILDPEGDYNTFPYLEATAGKLGRKKLFKEYSAITKPILIIAGSEDEAAATAGGAGRALELLKKHTNSSILNQSAFKLVPAADHNFTGCETEFAEEVAGWLAS